MTFLDKAIITATAIGITLIIIKIYDSKTWAELVDDWDFAKELRGDQ